MTSSLVGSEMCIRDSTTSTFGFRTCSLILRYSSRNAKVCQAGNHINNNAVSYTHLTLPTICSV
eukprot:7403381-Prorocentrum_lima.AAC.1